MTDTQTMPAEATGEALEKREKKPANQNKNKGRNRDRALDNFDPASDEPLVQPAEVVAPDETQHNKAVEVLKAKVEAGEEKIKAVDAEMEVLKGIREKQNSATKELSGELRTFRDQVREAQKDKDSISEQLTLLTEKKKQAQERIKMLKKQFKTTDAVAIDRMISEIQVRLETSSTDLKTEKDLVYQIKKLEADKSNIKGYEVELASVKGKEEQHEEMYQKLKIAKEGVQALRATEREMVQALDAAKAGAVEGEVAGAEVGNANLKIVELMNTKNDLVNANKEYRAGMKKLSVGLKITFAEYREYQQAMAAYKDKLDRVDQLKRRVEQQERYEQVKVERKEKDKKRSDDNRRIQARFLAVANGAQVYVGGLALRAEEVDLRTHFEPFGTITDMAVVRDNDTELSRGFSFVTFENQDMAKAAVKDMNRKEIKTLCPPHGRLAVKLAEKSRAQKEWEKANPNKLTKKKEEKKPREPREPKEKTEEATGEVTDTADAAASAKEEGDATENGVEVAEEEAAVVAEEVVPAAETDDNTDADKPDEDKPKKKGKGDGDKKQWEATREEWTKDEDKKVDNLEIESQTELI
mmetsp:Transcript_95150/g.138953  ORF Transcript_95150/g.138953 Transcript_95150/m.138953 type:complete len:583 (-) Transcript_95150:577-2325(-)